MHVSANSGACTKLSVKKEKKKPDKYCTPLYQYRNFNYLHLTMVFGDLVREGSLFDKKERKI